MSSLSTSQIGNVYITCNKNTYYVGYQSQLPLLEQFDVLLDFNQNSITPISRKIGRLEKLEVLCNDVDCIGSSYISQTNIKTEVIKTLKYYKNMLQHFNDEIIDWFTHEFSCKYGTGFDKFKQSTILVMNGNEINIIMFEFIPHWLNYLYNSHHNQLVQLYTHVEIRQDVLLHQKVCNYLRKELNNKSSWKKESVKCIAEQISIRNTMTEILHS